MVVVDKPTPKNSPVFIRGEAESRARSCRAVSWRSFRPKPQPFKDGSGRLELAKAIASKANPLTARVIVNRVWMHHFGEGFVRTPDDLGHAERAAITPGAARLSRLVSYGAKLVAKELHRLIMLSRVYQIRATPVRTRNRTSSWIRRIACSGAPISAGSTSRRCAIRCSSSAASSIAHVGGQPVNLTDEPYSYRRTVYGYIDRGNLPELMQNFDFSDPDMPNSKRTTTIVPQQALFLMNSPMAVDVARSVVARKEVAGAPNATGPRDRRSTKFCSSASPGRRRFELAYQFVSTDERTPAAMTDAQKKINETLQKKNGSKRERHDADHAQRRLQGDSERRRLTSMRKPLTPWETFAHALLLSNEAAYVN